MPRRRPAPPAMPVGGPDPPLPVEQPPPRLPGIRLNLSSVVLTGADFDLDLLGGGRLQKPPTTVKLGNVSGFVLEITIGGQQDHLAPGETNVFPTNGATTVHVHPVAITVPAG